MSDQPKWMEYIRTDQLPEDYQLLARIIGLELTIRVAYKLPKCHIYLKSPDRLFLPAKEAFIREQLAKTPGIDRRRLALAAEVSERHVYDLASEGQEKKQGWKQETLL